MKRKQKPITKHPMFPYVTALWFATFTGLGSFAIAPSLLEGPVVALGLPAILPAATPPLGFTARVLLALVLFVAGGIAGFVTGRALARDKVAEPRRTRDFSRTSREAEPTAPARGAFEPRRPLNPIEDLGEPLDAPITAEAPQRRRPLTVSEDDVAIVPYESAPLPGALPWDEPTTVAVADTDAEQAGPFAAPDPLALDQLIEQANAATLDLATPIVTDYEPDFDDEPVATLDLTSVAEGEVEDCQAEAVAAAPVEEAVEADVPAAPCAAASAPLFQAPAQPVTPIERADLDDLGLVQLVERLALAMSRRRPEQSRTANAEAPVVPQAPLSSSPVAIAPAAAPVVRPAEPLREVPRAIPRLQSTAADEPVQAPSVTDEVEAAASAFDRVVPLRPVMPSYAVDMSDDDDASDEELGLDRFLRVKPVVPTASDDGVVADEETGVADAENIAAPLAESVEEVAEDRYPSLLDLTPTTSRHDPLRIADGLAAPLADGEMAEPVVIFPGQSSSPLQAGTAQSDAVPPFAAERTFDRPEILSLPGSPLAAPGKAAPSAPLEALDAVPPAVSSIQPDASPRQPAADAEEADRALRAALATLQRMTAQN